MNNLSDTMNDLRRDIEVRAQDLTNGNGSPLVDNTVFRVGLDMLTPGSDIAVQSISGANVAARGLKMFVKAAIQRAGW